MTLQSGAIDFRFERLKLDGDALKTDWDTLLRLHSDSRLDRPPLSRG